ncbi:extracellular solute-binding protein [Brachyspira sp. G79]|uniref:extracellular solute-binding protein n=1 Tax=Brachyspira sp. G79 TaxID=1358104 RepID=UPI000BBCD59C|nr:extracellular solute-binding protein [Brachyspira sp. G79]PCG19041.1 ABC transporter substrate-binding protein [Brachyspira sp. G79]
MIRKYFYYLLLVSVTAIMLSCSGNNAAEQIEVNLPVIDTDTETELTVWGWNVAAKALMETAKTFNEKYPKIKINVQEFGGPPQLYEKAGVVLSSGQGIPDIMQIESDFIQTYSETYPQRFLDLKTLVPTNFNSIVDPSKVPTSYDTEGKLTSIPWDSGPVVIYYREDLFKEAGIDPNTIETYDDLIAAGKDLQAKLPNVKLTGFSFTQDDGVWRTLMVQNNIYYLDTNGNITLSSPRAVESMQLVKRLIDEGLVLNTVNWDTGIRAHKNGEIAMSFNGGWWGGTMKDQMPEMAGKWKAMEIPAYTQGGVRASSLGGSTLTITATDPIKQAAAWAFIEHSLLNTDSQLLMYEKYGLFPSYLPAYEDERFLQPDPYFGNQNYNELLGKVTKNIPPALYNSDDYSDLRNVAVSAYEEIINNNSDIQETLDAAAQQANSITGRKIIK